MSICLIWGMTTTIFAQNLKGKIFDAYSKEPVVGVTIKLKNTGIGTTTDATGAFSLQPTTETLVISAVGYQSIEIAANRNLNIALEPSISELQQVVVTASREAQKRTEAPVAIAKLSNQLLNDTKPLNIYELINKAPGVVMVNLNNEQHGMSIRQPLTLNSYFLYMEDGVPIRPMGLFNHNALIEQNIFAISNVEVVKGPASSLYGPEAVGGAINFITHRPTAVPTARIGLQADQFGYQRVQYSAGGMLTKRFGVYAGGFVARQRNSWLTTTDFDKTALNARLEYKISNRTQLTNTWSYNNYDSQMGGSLDSVSFYSRTYQSVADFTYRRVKALRSRLTLEHRWNDKAETSVTGFYRYNDYPMQPTFRITWRTGASTAAGEINNTIFNSYGLIAQHSQRFDFLNSKFLIGATADYSPVSYLAYQTELKPILRPDRRSVERYEFVRERPDLKVGNYDANVLSTGYYAQLDVRPLPQLLLTLGGRFDRMSFDYTNFLDNTSGNRAYQRFTPKIGLTYDLGQGRGLYANYSQGFAPPSVTAIFRRRTTPAPNGDLFFYNLQPARFNNVELGGWASLFRNKLYVDAAVYQMEGFDEILSVRLPDNSTDSRSAGQTLHRGVEFGMTYKPNKEWLVRFGGAHSVHRFVEFALSERAADVVKNVNGFDMPSAPRYRSNTEVFYKPKWFKGFRIAAEWQYLSPWFTNQVNTNRYDDRTALGLRGMSLLNLRTGYEWKGIEVFLNILNLTDELYTNSISRGNAPTDRATYTPGAPRTFVMGIQYNFVGKK